MAERCVCFVDQIPRRLPVQGPGDEVRDARLPPEHLHGRADLFGPTVEIMEPHTDVGLNTDCNQVAAERPEPGLPGEP